MVPVFLVLGSLELLFHAHGREVRDVRELAGVRKANVRSCLTFIVIVATVEVRVLRNDIAGHDFKAECLARKARRACNYDDALHLFRVVNRPFHRLESAHGSADDAVEFLDAKTVCKFLLGMHHVAYRNGREGAAVGLARARVDRCRAGRTLASTKDVAANYKESVCIDSLARSDEFIPPAGLLVIFGVPAGGVCIGGQRRTNPHGVIAGGVQCAVRFVTDGQGRERLAVFQ